MASIAAVGESLQSIHLSMFNSRRKLPKEDISHPSEIRAKALNSYVEIVASLCRKSIPLQYLQKEYEATQKKLPIVRSKLAHLSNGDKAFEVYSRLLTSPTKHLKPEKDTREDLQDIHERTGNLQNQLTKLSDHSLVESLALASYDLPRKPLYALLEQTHAYTLDRLKEQYAMAIKLYPLKSPIYIGAAYSFFFSPIESGAQYKQNEPAPLPLKTHRFFHAKACGENIKHGDVLGKGSFGEIKQSTLTDMSFASKLMSQDYNKYVQECSVSKTEPLTEEDYIKNNKISFDIETCSLLQLNHPNILKLYAVSKIKEKPALFLELAHENLWQFFSRQPKPHRFIIIDATTRNKMFSQITSALHHIHSRGIIHKDLTASNILLTIKGTIKIADFGLATLYNQTKITDMVYYNAPPESLFSEGVSNKCDIWSLGVVLHQSFTKFWPYPKITTQETDEAYRKRLYGAFCVKGGKINPLFQEPGWDAHDPDHFWRGVIAQCLSPLPENRPEANYLYRRLTEAKKV